MNADDNILTMEERYAEAAVDSRDMDTLAAAGMTGQKHGSATRVMRLIDSLDAHEYKDTLEEFARLILQQADRQRISVTYAEAKSGATLFAGYLIAPICPSCLGRGANLIGGDTGGRGVLGSSCGHCGGIGKRNLFREAAVLGDVMQDMVRWLNGEVMSQSIMASRSMARNRFHREV